MKNITNKKRLEYETHLTTGQIPSTLNDDENRVLIFKGMVWNLYLSGTVEAVDALKQSAQHCPIAELEEDIIISLDLLAQNGNVYAQNAVFDLAVSHKNQRAVSRILAHQYQASIPELNAAFAFFYQTKETFLSLDPKVELLTDFIVQSPYKELQNRAREQAQTIGMDNWAIMLKAILLDQPDDYKLLLETFPRFNTLDVDLLAKLLADQAVRANLLAQEAICDIFVQYDAWMFREIATENQYQLLNPIQNALFLFLSEQWADYEAIDFNHSFISTAYQNADEQLRKRILAHSRYTGHTDWLQMIQATTPTRQINEMNDADWEMAIEYLTTENKWEELWKLAQYAPAIFSMKILNICAEHHWHPEFEASLNQFDLLLQLAKDCAQTPLDLPDHTALQIADQITCLAIAPDAQHAATGTNTNEIQIWKIGEANYLEQTIQTVTAQTRALAYSPDNDYLAVACGDNKIRIFRSDQYQNVQTFSGHKGFIRSLQFSSDAHTLYSGAFDKTINAWRFPQGSLRWTKSLKAELFNLEFASETNSLISAGGEDQIQIWNLPDGENRRNLQQDAQIIPVFTVSKNGQLLASFNDKKNLQIWNYISGKQLLELNLPELSITQMIFQKDEHMLILATVDGQIILLSPSTGKMIASWKIEKGAITGIALTNMDTTLITTHMQGRISFWNLDTLKLARQPVKTNVSSTKKIIEEKLDLQLPKSEKQWLRFIQEMIKWNQRFDISISATSEIQTSSFEIHL